MLSIKDGTTYSTKDLISIFGFRSDRATKDWIKDNHVIYHAIGGIWFVAGEDIRAAMRRDAEVHDDQPRIQSLNQKRAARSRP